MRHERSIHLFSTVTLVALRRAFWANAPQPDNRFRNVQRRHHHGKHHRVAEHECDLQRWYDVFRNQRDNRIERRDLLAANGDTDRKDHYARLRRLPLRQRHEQRPHTRPHDLGHRRPQHLLQRQRRHRDHQSGHAHPYGREQFDLRADVHQLRFNLRHRRHALPRLSEHLQLDQFRHRHRHRRRRHRLLARQLRQQRCPHGEKLRRALLRRHQHHRQPRQRPTPVRRPRPAQRHAHQHRTRRADRRQLRPLRRHGLRRHDRDRRARVHLQRRLPRRRHALRQSLHRGEFLRALHRWRLVHRRHRYPRQ